MPTIHTLLWATETHAFVFDIYDNRDRALQTARNTMPTMEGHSA